MKSWILDWINPPGYNAPDNLKYVWNQWLHQGYMWDWYSYDFYQSHTVEPE